MARYSQEIIEQVQEANDIIDVVSDYVTLKRSGNSFMGKCPFHNEKTASFSVSQEKQLYHCFGCGVGGNVIGFIMAIENLPFPEAVQFLARRAHITLPENSGSPEEEARFRYRERLYEMQRQLANYYYVCLKHASAAKTYLSERGITAETIKAFGLGYSPDSWDSAVRFLAKQGFTVKEICDAGIGVPKKNGGCYDRFRGRIMFPILNPTGRVIGFGGRRMKENDRGPKYLNSPETPVFTKGNELFNMNHAKSAIHDDQILIVEGYMDVISLYQSGVKNAVAALGTAFTPYHAAMLKRYVSEVVLCFDGDAAGEAATQKALAVLKNSPLNIKILRLPPEDDPDSYIQKNGREAFDKCVKEAITVVEYEIGLLKKQYDLDNTDDRIKYTNAAIEIIRELKDPVQIDLYTKRLARETGINQRIILRESNRKKEPAAVTQEEAGVKIDYFGNIPKAYEQAQIIYMRNLVNDPTEIEEDLLDASDFSPGFFRDLYICIIEYVKAGKKLTPAVLVNEFEDSQRIQAISAMLMDDRPINKKRLDDSIELISRFSKRNQMDAFQKKSEMMDEEEAIVLAQKIATMKKNQ